MSGGLINLLFDTQRLLDDLQGPVGFEDEAEVGQMEDVLAGVAAAASREGALLEPQVREVLDGLLDELAMSGAPVAQPTFPGSHEASGSTGGGA